MMMELLPTTMRLIPLVIALGNVTGTSNAIPNDDVHSHRVFGTFGTFGFFGIFLVFCMFWYEFGMLWYVFVSFGVLVCALYTFL